MPEFCVPLPLLGRWIKWLRAVIRSAGQGIEGMPIDEAHELAEMMVAKKRAPDFVSWIGAAAAPYTRRTIEYPWEGL